MNLNKNILEFLQANLYDDYILFNGLFGTSIKYYLDDHKWINNNYFNYFLNKEIVQEVIIYSSIQEFIHFSECYVRLDSTTNDYKLVLISNEETNNYLFDFIYKNLVKNNIEPRYIIHCSKLNYDGLINVISINNFYSKNKIKYNIVDDRFYISNDQFENILIDYKKINLLKSLINYKIQIRLLDTYLINSNINI